MPVPRFFSAVRLLLFPALLLLSDGALSGARGPEPSLRLPLEAMGYQSPGAGSLALNGSMATVHFIDDQHLLVTFAVRRLMKRLPDDPPDDEDRTIEAVLVHLPSGKVVARTNWRLHDTLQYLWDLGHGRFLLRLRDTLTTFVPLVNLGSGDAFRQQPFLLTTPTRKMAAIMMSPDRDLVTIETVDRPPLVAGDKAGTVLANRQEPRRVQLNFYRILQPAEPADKVVVQAAGVAAAGGLVNLSLTAAGYVEVLQESTTRWLFDFDAYTGKYVELSPFDTSCRPRPVFVSASEFVAFGCRGGDDRLTIGGFNMRGEQMWQQNFVDAHAFPNFAFAPAAGRFALSRNVVAATAGITVDFAPSEFTMQEIRVYQTYSGKQLLRVEATPVQRFGQNYDLSTDGLRLALIRAGAVEVYRLPGLTGGDETAVRASRTLAPEDKYANVNLAPHARPTIGKTQPPAESVPPFVPAVRPSAPLEAPVPQTAGATGNVEPSTEEPRKPPTLYTLPTDKPAEPQL